MVDKNDNEIYRKLTEIVEAANKKQTAEILVQVRTEVKNELDELTKIITEEKKKLSDLELKYTELKEKHDILEKTARKNNIVIFGLNKPSNRTHPEFVINQINSLLNLELTLGDLNNLYEIGKEDKRRIIVEFRSYLLKRTVLNNCRKLKGKNIFISEQLTAEERSNFKVLRKRNIHS